MPRLRWKAAAANPSAQLRGDVSRPATGPGPALLGIPPPGQMGKQPPLILKRNTVKT